MYGDYSHQRKKYFVEEQREGPYRILHHEHHDKSVEVVEHITDILHYDIGKWIFCWIAGKLFVNTKVKGIFEYRNRTLETYFKK